MAPLKQPKTTRATYSGDSSIAALVCQELDDALSSLISIPEWWISRKWPKEWDSQAEDVLHSLYPDEGDLDEVRERNRRYLDRFQLSNGAGLLSWLEYFEPPSYIERISRMWRFLGSSKTEACEGKPASCRAEPSRAGKDI